MTSKFAVLTSTFAVMTSYSYVLILNGNLAQATNKSKYSAFKKNY